MNVSTECIHSEETQVKNCSVGLMKIQFYQTWTQKGLVVCSLQRVIIVPPGFTYLIQTYPALLIHHQLGVVHLHTLEIGSHVTGSHFHLSSAI